MKQRSTAKAHKAVKQRAGAKQRLLIAERRDGKPRRAKPKRKR